MENQKNQANTGISAKEQNSHSCIHCQKRFFCVYDEWQHIQGICNKICEDCHDEILGKKLYSKSEIPEKFKALETDKKELLGRSIVAIKGGFYWGGVGTGKSTFCASLIKKLTLEEKKECFFISSANLVMKLQDMYRKSSESPYDYLKELSKKQILVIDDLGAEKLTDFVKQAIYFLINEREQWNRKTFITSNYSLDELDRLFDARISSRIAGMCDVVEFTGKDRRIENRI